MISKSQKLQKILFGENVLNKIEIYLISLPRWIFYPITSILFIFINVRPYAHNRLIMNYSTNILAGESLPKPVNFTSSNLLPAIIYRVFDINADDYSAEASSRIYVALLIFITVFTYLFFIFAISKLPTQRNRRFLTIVFVFLPMHRFLAPPFDVYDIFIYFGIAVLIYGLVTQNHFNSFFIGSFMFIFSHPEQALASFAGLFLLSLNKNFQFLTKLAIKSLLFTILTNFSVHIWYYLYGYRDARAIEIIFGFFPITLPGHITHPYDSVTTIFKMYGVLWILVFFSLKLFSEKLGEKSLLSISIIGTPFFFWFVTSDGLRCVVPMTTLLSLVLAFTLTTKEIQSPKLR